MSIKKLWIAFGLVMIISFGILGYYGAEIYRKAPPIPEKVIDKNGKVILTASQIKDGQNVWQSMGGQELGSIWGHGAYQAPDWTADRLYREAVYMLDLLAKNHYQLSFDELSKDKQAGLKILLQEDIRKNTYDEDTRTITISDLRYQAYLKVNKHYEGLFTDDPAFDYWRDA